MKKEIIKQFVITNDILVKDYIKNNIGKKFYRYLKSHNAIFYLDSKCVNNYDICKSGNILTIKYFVEEVQLNKTSLKIVYEDDSLIVIDKPHNINTIPASKNDLQSIYNLLVDNKATKLHFINRLDKETAGLLLICKDKYCANILSKEIKKIDRIYLAVCSGIFKNVKTIITNIKKSDDSIKREVCIDGDISITHVKFIKNIENNSLLKLKLQTGRTHQIRVHLSYFSHPIIGDGLYGEKKDIMCLHSTFLGFNHPITKERLEFKSLPCFLGDDELLKIKDLFKF